MLVKLICKLAMFSFCLDAIINKLAESGILFELARAITDAAGTPESPNAIAGLREHFALFEQLGEYDIPGNNRHNREDNSDCPSDRPPPDNGFPWAE